MTPTFVHSPSRVTQAIARCLLLTLALTVGCKPSGRAYVGTWNAARKVDMGLYFSTCECVVDISPNGNSFLIRSVGENCGVCREYEGIFSLTPEGNLKGGALDAMVMSFDKAKDQVVVSAGGELRYMSRIAQAQRQTDSSTVVENIAQSIPVDTDPAVERLLSATIPATAPYDKYGVEKHLQIPEPLGWMGSYGSIRVTGVGYRLPGRKQYRCMYYLQSGKEHDGPYELIDDFVSDWSYSFVGDDQVFYCPDCAKVTKDAVQYSFVDQQVLVKRRGRQPLARPWQWPPNPALQRTRFARR